MVPTWTRSGPSALALIALLSSCRPSAPTGDARPLCDCGESERARPESLSPAGASETNSSAPHAEPIADEVSFSEAERETVDFSAHFSAEGAEGAFVGFDSTRGKVVVHAPELAQTGFLPASTFKIPHAAIALETGALASADEVIPWDGERRWHPNWNMDLTLREAIRHSSWPHFMTIAERIGPERMQTWLEKFEYGNQKNTGGDSLFWLMGDLRITPLEQVAFLQRLRKSELPISEPTRGVIREMLFFGRRGEAKVYGKSGSTDPNGPKPVVHWFVGWVERKETTYYFATLLVDPPEGKWGARMLITDRALSSLGML